MIINKFEAGSGIRIEGVQGSTSGNTIVNNYIGTDTTGTVAKENGTGITIIESKNNTIDDNLISGNGTRGIAVFGGQKNRIIGNYIGTDVNGTNAVANGVAVYLEETEGNFVGSVGFGEGNLISGNDDDGIEINGGTGIFIWNNNIGIQANGTSGLGNKGSGVHVGSGNLTIIEFSNAIADNQGNGVELDTGVTNTFIQGALIGKNRAGAALPNGKGPIFGRTNPGTKVISNYIGGGPGASIDFASTTGLEIDGNIIEDGLEDAIKLDAVSQVLITGNTVTGHAGRGVLITGASTSVTVGGSNTIYDNDGEAVAFGGGSNHNLFSNYIEGDVDIASGVSVVGKGAITGDGPMTNAGSFTIADEYEPTSFSLAGSYTQTGGSTYVAWNASFSTTGDFTQQGGTTTIVSDSSLNVGASLAHTGGNLTVDFSTLTVGTSFQVTGGTATLLYSSASVGGSVTVTGLLRLQSSELAVAAMLSIAAAGTLEATGGAPYGATSPTPAPSAWARRQAPKISPLPATTPRPAAAGWRCTSGCT